MSNSPLKDGNYFFLGMKEKNYNTVQPFDSLKTLSRTTAIPESVVSSGGQPTVHYLQESAKCEVFQAASLCDVSGNMFIHPQCANSFSKIYM